jgi:hypothetical protein
MSTVNDHSAFYVENLDKAENPAWEYRLYRSERIPLLDLCYIMLCSAMLIYLVLGTVNLTTTCILFDLLKCDVFISLRCDLETNE